MRLYFAVTFNEANVNQWYQLKVAKGCTLDQFFELKGFLGSYEKEECLILYFDKTEEVKEKLKGLDFSVISEGDWAEKWRDYFVPVKIGSLTVVPPWLKSEGNVVINPALGFGTGHHETTRLAIELIEEVLEKDNKINNLLDVGTGSGILSIAALRLKSDLKVRAIDNDSCALENCAENLKLNGIEESVKLSSEPLAKLGGKYDIVVANIISSVLFSLAEELKNGAGMWLILSGILTSEEGSFLQKMGLDDFSLVRQKRENEWSAFLLKRKE